MTRIPVSDPPRRGKRAVAHPMTVKQDAVAIALSAIKGLWTLFVSGTSISRAWGQPFDLGGFQEVSGYIAICDALTQKSSHRRLIVDHAFLT